MTTKAVEEALENKSPVTRESEAHNKTFEIRAIREEEGIKCEITGIEVYQRFAPMHYDLKWSTSDSKKVPFSGTRVESREKALKSAEGRRPGATPTAKPASNVALTFETINGETYHFRQSIDHRNMEPGDLYYELLVNRDPSNIDKENSIPATYEPTSDNGGELRVQTSSGKLEASLRAFEGETDEKYVSDEELLEWHTNWLLYENEASNSDGWIECPVINAYEDENGDEIAVVVETPVGEPTVFEFEVTTKESDPYWVLVDGIASGDPANLGDSDSSVYIRHRYHSFYEFGPYRHDNIVRERLNDVISIDVNKEWEMRVTSPSIVRDSISNSESCGSLISRLSGVINRIV